MNAGPGRGLAEKNPAGEGREAFEQVVWGEGVGAKGRRGKVGKTESEPV